MNAKLVDSLAQIIQTLTIAERQELDTKLSTPVQNSKITDRSRSVGSAESARFQQWDQVSEEISKNPVRVASLSRASTSTEYT
jgi:hypothetical protein